MLLFKVYLTVFLTFLNTAVNVVFMYLTYFNMLLTKEMLFNMFFKVFTGA